MNNQVKGEASNSPPNSGEQDVQWQPWDGNRAGTIRIARPARLLSQ